MVATCLLLAKKLVPGDFKDLSTLVTVHIQGVQYAGVYYWRLKKFSDMGADAAGRLAKDPNIQFLAVLQASKAKCSGHVASLAEAQEGFESTVVKQASDIGSDEATCALLQHQKAMDVILGACEPYIMEFVDCLKYHSNVMQERLKELSRAAIEAASGYQAGGANFWRAEVAPEATVADLQRLMLADDFKAKIKLTAIRAATDSVLQVGFWADEQCMHFNQV